MTSPLNDNEQRDRDICRYLDGRMDAQQRASFERQMLRDPHLHHETQRFAESDRQVRDALEELLERPAAPQRTGQLARRRPLASLPAAAAVAAMLLAMVSYYVMVLGPEASSTPSGGEAAESVASDRLPDGRGPGSSTARHGDGAPSSALSAVTDAETGPGGLMFANVACEDTPVAPTVRGRVLEGYAQDPPLPCSYLADSPPQTHQVTRRLYEVTDEASGEEYIIQIDEVNSRVAMTATDL